MTVVSQAPASTIDAEAERLTGFQVGVTIPDEALDLVSGARMSPSDCVLTDHGEDAFCAAMR